MVCQFSRRLISRVTMTYAILLSVMWNIGLTSSVPFVMRNARSVNLSEPTTTLVSNDNTDGSRTVMLLLLTQPIFLYLLFGRRARKEPVARAYTRVKRISFRPLRLPYKNLKHFALRRCIYIPVPDTLTCFTLPFDAFELMLMYPLYCLAEVGLNAKVTVHESPGAIVCGRARFGE